LGKALHEKNVASSVATLASHKVAEDVTDHPDRLFLAPTDFDRPASWRLRESQGDHNGDKH
jgi:hypothetical protein